PSTRTYADSPDSPRRIACATETFGAIASNRPTRARGPKLRWTRAPTPRGSTPTTARTRGATGGIIGAGPESKGPEEPTRHVGVDAIAAVSVARPLRADQYARARPPRGQCQLSTRFEGRARLVHGRSTSRAPRGSARRPSRRR